MSTAVATNAPQGTSRYISFVGESSKRGKQEYQAAGGKIPGFALKGAGMIIPLGGDTLKLSVASAVHLITRTDRQGKITGAYRAEEFPGKKDNKGNWVIDGSPDRWDDHYFATVLLWGEGNAVNPASVQFRGPAAKAIENAVKNLDHAKDDKSWGRLASINPAYKASIGANGAAGRFVATSKIEPVQSKQTGNFYNKGTCFVRPTNAEEVAAYNALGDDKLFLADLLACEASTTQQVNKALTGDADEEV